MSEGGWREPFPMGRRWTHWGTINVTAPFSRAFLFSLLNKPQGQAHIYSSVIPMAASLPATKAEVQVSTVTPEHPKPTHCCPSPSLLPRTTLRKTASSSQLQSQNRPQWGDTLENDLWKAHHP